MIVGLCLDFTFPGSDAQIETLKKLGTLQSQEANWEITLCKASRIRYLVIAGEFENVDAPAYVATTNYEADVPHALRRVNAQLTQAGVIESKWIVRGFPGFYQSMWQVLSEIALTEGCA